ISADLGAQVQEGAPADLVASADEATMERLTADGLAGADPVAFASNTLRIAVPAGNPADVSGLADLTGDLDVVVCAPEVPCGAAARRVAARADGTLTPASEGRSLTDVLAEVTTGAADAGLASAADVAPAPGLGSASCATPGSRPHPDVELARPGRRPRLDRRPRRRGGGVRAAPARRDRAPHPVEPVPRPAPVARLRRRARAQPADLRHEH